MDLSRQEYPALLDGLQPSQAVALVNDRMEYISRLNNGIAEWLEDRRRVEEAYASGMRKLARRKLPDEAVGLGAFSSAWQKIVSSTEELAASHHTLARNIEADVERPLRSFSSTNAEMQAMSTMQGNLASIARETESAAKKSGRGRNGSTDNAQWDSQAPFVMEQLQAADESRCNHLRDALTQFQTHEVDQVERSRVTAEQCLNALLMVETADEIKLFAVRNARGDGLAAAAAPAPSTPRRPERRIDTQSSRTNTNLAPPPVHTPTFDDLASTHSESIHEEEKKKSRFGGIKRLGTVFKGKRNSMLPGSQATPPSKNRNLARSPSPNFAAIRESDSRAPTPVRESLPPVPSVQEPHFNESPARREELSPAPTNGTRDTSSGFAGLQEPLRPEPASAYEAPPGPPPQTTSTRDADGFSTPSAVFDPISQAQQEAASSNDPSARQYNVDIRNAPIAEEDNEAGSAMANMASALRAQAGPQRRGTTRGRRDVRNTMFGNDNFGEQQQQSPLPPIPQEQPSSSLPSGPSSSNLIMTPFIASIAGGQAPAATQPTVTAHRPFPGVERADSDSTSVRSGRSSVTGGDVLSKHAEMNQQGLNVSMVETVSAWFESGAVTRAVVIGEMALANNAGSFPSASTTETIRIDNFAALEKVAPNPAFITQRQAQSGEYTIDVSTLSRAPAVGFKYQIHVDPTAAATHAPFILAPQWRIEPTQTSVILSYQLNPALGHLTTPLTLSNVVVSIVLDTSGPGAGRPTACQSKPAGTFSKERATISWRLGEITLAPGAGPQKLLARFSTEGQARQGRAEARWEIVGAPQAIGSGLGVSVLESAGGGASADPFADEDGAGDAGLGTWRSVQSSRKVVSGTYQAN